MKIIVRNQNADIIKIIGHELAAEQNRALWDCQIRRVIAYQYFDGTVRDSIRIIPQSTSKNKE